MSADVAWIRMRKAVPWLWLALSVSWAVVIVITDQLAWPLALWIATTVGPLIYLRRSNDQSDPSGRDTKGPHE